MNLASSFLCIASLCDSYMITSTVACKKTSHTLNYLFSQYASMAEHPPIPILQTGTCNEGKLNHKIF